MNQLNQNKMNDNELIAEFMGVADKPYCYIPEHTLDVYDENGFFQEKSNHFQYNELKYHTSWDWLMPVVSKCFKTGDDTHQWDNIMDAMFTCDINIVYAQVVEFINQYNNE